MTPYLFWELLFLGIGVWFLVLVVVIYTWVLLQRQKRFMNNILEKLNKQAQDASLENSLESSVRPVLDEEKSIAISKDEPIAKYADMTVEDSVNVSFVEPNANDKS